MSLISAANLMRHLVSAQDVFKTQAQIEAAGGKITREAGAIPGLGTKIVRPMLALPVQLVHSSAHRPAHSCVKH